MKRTTAILVPAIILAAVVIPWVIVPLRIDEPKVKNYSTEELVVELKNRSLFDGDFESLLEVPELWHQFSKKINQLSEEEKQDLLGEFIGTSIKRLDDKLSSQVQLLISLETLGHVGFGFERLHVHIRFPDGTLEPVEHDDTSFQTGINDHGSYCELGISVDFSNFNSERQYGCKIVLTSEMTLGESPELPYYWRAEYDLE